MIPTPGYPDDNDLRRALVDRLVAWRMLKRYRLPIGRYSPAVRRRIEETSARFQAAKRTIMDALELLGGRWVDPSNPVELVLHPDGDGFLMLAPGVIRPERWLVRAADRVNAMRFGTHTTPRPRQAAGNGPPQPAGVRHGENRDGNSVPRQESNAAFWRRGA